MKAEEKKSKSWYQKNKEEIIDTITIKRQMEYTGKLKGEINDRIEREYKTIKIPLIMGFLYVSLGIILLYCIHNKNLLVSFPEMPIVGLELIVLGIYALLYSFIFYCVCGHNSDKKIIKIIEEILIVLMYPYHFCIKVIKAFIKDKRQEHVIYLFPYYLISLVLALFSAFLIMYIISQIGENTVYEQVIIFFIVCWFIFVFFAFGNLNIFILVKWAIRREQKEQIKGISKVNWRGTMKDEAHRQARKNKFNCEWNIIKKELEYTRIYVYIILTILVLWIPKRSGSLTEMFVNQFLGITTIAALAREAKAKRKDDDL